tara:strand:- start:495 stop:794 length:300 start_codon:yes stop_codon:yes gene_type:complete
MPNKRILYYFIFIPIFFSCSNVNINNEKIKIFFEKPLTLAQEQKLVLALSENFSNKNLFALLNNQNWIESFLIKKSLFQQQKYLLLAKNQNISGKKSFI